MNDLSDEFYPYTLLRLAALSLSLSLSSLSVSLSDVWHGVCLCVRVCVAGQRSTAGDAHKGLCIDSSRWKTWNRTPGSPLIAPPSSIRPAVKWSWCRLSRDFQDQFWSKIWSLIRPWVSSKPINFLFSKGWKGKPMNFLVFKQWRGKPKKLLAVQQQLIPWYQHVKSCHMKFQSFH